MNGTTADLIIRAKRTVFPDGIRPAAILITGETITGIEDFDTPTTASQDHTVPDDQVLMPGFVDSHVHVNEPGRTLWEGYKTATRAALAGGITTILDMPLNSHPPTVTTENLALKHEAALGKLSVDVGLWGGAIPGNRGDLAPLWEQGVYGFKCFTAHSGIDEYGSLAYSEIEEDLTEIARLGAVMIVHAEDPQILNRAPQEITREYSTYLASRPGEAEKIAIERVIAAAKATGARVHILHLAYADALETIAAAKADGVHITVETCPHYLTFAAEEIPDGATEYKCAPPLREEANRRALWQGLKEGIIDHIASDHSPCTIELKRKDTGDFGAAWGGISSVQLGPAAVWTAGAEFDIELSDIARWFAANPARNFEVLGKGAIAVGNDADLIFFDPEAEFTVDVETLEHRNKISPYHGRTLKGRVTERFLRGQQVTLDSLHGQLLRHSGHEAL